MSEYLDEIDELYGENNLPQRTATARAVSEIDADPEQMARSIHLSRGTQIPAEVIDADLEGFERNHKAALVGDMVKYSPALQEYVNTYGPAARVSNDDYPQLHKLHGTVNQYLHTAFDEGWKAVKEGFGDAPLVAPVKDEDVVNHPVLTFAWQAIANPFSLAGRALTGAAHGAAAFGASLLSPIPGIESERLKKELTGMADWALMRGDMGGIKPQLQHAEIPAVMARQAVTRGNLLGRYIQSGELPPPGVMRELDAVYEKLAGEDAKNFREAVKAAKESLTVQRSVEAAEAALKPVVGDRKIGISAEGIQELYKDKAPEPGDGMLGDIEGLREQLTPWAIGDVEVPLEKFLVAAARNPDMAKALEQHLRLRPEGMTEAEAKTPRAVEGEVLAQAKRPTITGYHGSTDVISEFDPEKTRLDRGVFFSEKPELASKFAEGRAADSDPLRIHGEDTPAEIEKFVRELAGDTEAKRIKTMLDEFEAKYGGQEFLDKEGTALSNKINDELRKVSRLSEEAGGGHANVSRVELDLGKIYEVDMGGKFDWGREHEAIEFAKKEGYNSVKFTNTGEEGAYYSVFDKAQIKPAQWGPIERDVNSIESAVRAEAGLEPLADVGKTVRLKYSTSAPDPTEMLPGKPAPIYHTYNLMDGRKKVGHVTGRFDDASGTFFVKLIETEKIGGPNSIGPRAVKDIFSQLQEEFPGMKKVMGYRVSGARERAGKEDFATVNLPASPQKLAEFVGELKGWDKVETAPDVEPPKPGTIISDLGNGTIVHYRPSEFFDANETKIVAAINELLNRIAPGLEWAPTDKIITQGGGMKAPAEVQGFYNSGSKVDQIKARIVVALVGPHAVGTALHEVIHHLRSGFFTVGEWSRLERAAMDGRWVEKHSIDTRYPTAPEWLKLEESIAEEYKYYASNNLMKSKYSPETLTIFKKLDELWQSIKTVMRAMFGPEGEGIEHLFEKVSSGEVGSRKPTTFGAERFKTLDRSAGEVLAQAARDEEASLFSKAQTFGYTQEQFKRVLRKLDEQREELDAKAKARAERQARQGETELWKEHEPEVRKDVTEQINTRPDIMADEYLRRGMINDQKVKSVRLGSEFLSEEQKKSLGKGMHAKDGVDPEQVAPIFGFHSGEAMLNSLVALAEARGDRPARAYKAMLIKTRTEQIMEQKYGSEIAALQEMREDVVSTTALDLLHEEMVALGTKAGAEILGDKDYMKAAVAEQFRQLPTDRARNMNSYMRTAGRFGRAAEDALWKQDFINAFQAKQAQFISLLMADEAKRFSKTVARAERNFDRLSSNKTITTIPQDWVDQLHRIMDQIEVGNKRNAYELATALQGYTLDKFIQEKTVPPNSIDVADFLLDPAFKKDWKTMSVEDFIAVHESVQTLMHYGREEKKILTTIGKEEHATLVKEAQEASEKLTRSYIPRDPNQIQKLKSMIKDWDAGLLKIEQLIDWLDQYDLNGVFNRVIFRPLTEAKHVENDLKKEMGGKLKQLPTKDIKWDKPISHPEILDWQNSDPIHLTEKDLIGIMLNMGTDLNYKKLTAEFKYENSTYQTFTPQTLEALVLKNARKEHWDYVQGMWDIFDSLWPKIEELSRNTSGIAPDKKLPRAIQTAFGNYKGGYYPLIPDWRWEGPGAGGERGLFSEDKYTRAIPPKNYTKKVTEITYPLSFDGAAAQQRLLETIHDLAFREPLIAAEKFLRDADVKRAIRNGLGPEYEAQFRPWLEYVANPSGMRAIANAQHAGLNAFLRGARDRIVAVQLMYRASTIMKHSIAAALDSAGELSKIGARSPGLAGLKEYAAEFTSFIAKPWDIKRKAEAVFAESGEMRNRLHDMDRDIGEMLDQAMGKSSFKATMMHWGGIGVATLDIGTAIPTYTLAKKWALARGATLEEAIAAGEKAVRNAHGSGGVTDLSQIMRGSDTVRALTIAFGFFNHNYNRVRTIGRLLGKEGAAGDFMKGNTAEAWMKLGRASWMSLWYILILAIVEESISGIPSKEREKEGWGHYIGAGVVHQLMATQPVLREMTGTLMGEPRRSQGPIAQVGESIFRTGQQTWKVMHNEKVDNYLRHVMESAGYLFAIPGMGQAGVTSQYLWDLKTGKQRAEGVLLGRGFGTNVVPFGHGTHARGVTLGKSNPYQR